MMVAFVPVCAVVNCMSWKCRHHIKGRQPWKKRNAECLKGAAAERCPLPQPLHRPPTPACHRGPRVRTWRMEYKIMDIAWTNDFISSQTSCSSGEICICSVVHSSHSGGPHTGHQMSFLNTCCSPHPCLPCLCSELARAAIPASSSSKSPYSFIVFTGLTILIFSLVTWYLIWASRFLCLCSMRL